MPLFLWYNINVCQVEESKRQHKERTMDEATAKQRIAELKQLLERYNEEYYVQDTDRNGL